MKKRNEIKKDTSNFTKRNKRSHVLIYSFVFLLTFFFYTNKGLSQIEVEFYEISVFVDIHRVGGTEIPAVIKGHEAYISITDFFSFLRIKNTPSNDFITVSGYILNEQSTYTVDRNEYIIKYKGKVFHLENHDLIRTETGLYLNSKLFGEIFDLDCVFNFRNLMVIVNTKLDLPIIREIRLNAMRQNINRLNGEKQADTTIAKSYPIFSLGMADWSIYLTQDNNKSNTRASLSLGSIIAGGETNITLNYDSDHDFNEKQQFYKWRIANNSNRFVKQVIAGKINPYSTSSIYEPVIGIQLTNSPTTYRRSYGTYTLSDYTNPGWTVELYVNNMLIDYKEADAAGFFTFEVPLIYGNTEINLRFYGPWGEEQFKKVNIKIPYNFIPKNELEYRITGGFVEDSVFSKYSRSEINYGISRHITIGGGAEYLSSVSSDNFMPFINTNISLGGNLLFSGNYTHRVKAMGILNYRFLSGLQLDLSYTNYHKGQTAINLNYLETRKAGITIPIKSGNIALFTRASLNQYILPTTQYINAEILISGNIYGVSTNITTYAFYTDQQTPYIYSNLLLGFKLPKHYFLRTQCQYDFKSNDLISAKIEIEKRFLKYGYFIASYENHLRSSSQSIQVGFRFDLSFVQTSLFVRSSNESVTFFETARGSLQFENKTNYFKTTNRSSVGRGGVIIIPYLDLNNNGKYDSNESKVCGVDIKVNSGRTTQNDKDTTIVVSEMEPYTSHILSLSLSRVDNIAWVLRKSTIKTTINPNQLQVIEIPVSILGEVSGTIYYKRGSHKTGFGRIIIDFFDKDNKKVASTLSEGDGYFSYLGLPPGAYTVKISTNQLSKMKMESLTNSTSIIIHQSIDGDIIDDINFTIRKK